MLISLAVGLVAAPVAQEMIQVPTCKPDLKMVYRIMAHWKVEHQSSIAAGQYWGMTDYRTGTIFLSDEPSERIQIETAIHETIHICYHDSGIELPREVEEHAVAVQAREMYVELFGSK
jgi:hypothetical protein